MTRVKTIFLTAAMLMFGLFAGSVQALPIVPDWNMAGIPDAGYPHFQDQVKVSFTKQGTNWVLKAVQTGTIHLWQLNKNKSYTVTGTTFALSATFDKKLKFTSGSLKIAGKIPGWKVAQQTLWQTKLVGFGYDLNGLDASPVALGFKTAGHSGWAKKFSSGAPESVYLFANSKPFLTLATNIAKGKGIVAGGISANAITTVPVPPAMWLLGSALAGMGIIGRRRSPVAA